MVMLMYSRRAVGASSRTQRSCQGQNSQRKLTSQNSRPYIVLKLLHDSHGHASSPTQRLFLIGHGLHPHNTCSPLVMAYTNALLVFW